MPRTARERLLAGATQLMARDGVAGMGVAELIEHSKVSRRSVYVNFPRGKAELVADATKSAGEIITGVLEKLVQQAPVSSALASLGALVGAHVAGSDYTMGCPIAAATLGRSEAPRPPRLPALPLCSGWTCWPVGSRRMGPTPARRSHWQRRSWRRLKARS